ncbi:MAG: PEP-CTERM sorting domain-containing protein [Phycisphaerae bacterium]
MVRRGLVVVAALSLVFGLAGLANAQDNGQGLITISLDPPPPPGGYAAGESISASVLAEISIAPVNDPVVLRGIQLDFQTTDANIGLPTEFSFNDPSGGLYAPFPALPQPNMVWPIGNPIPALMVNLSNGQQNLGSAAITAPATAGDSGFLRISDPGEADPNFGMSLKFGFGVDADDPLTDWRFNNGGLTGMHEVEIPTVPEPATLALLAIGAVATLRRRRSA